MPTTLDALVPHAPGAHVRGDGATLIGELAYDARAVAPGSLFFCIPGARADGHDFAGAAVAAGADALVVERVLDLEVPQVVVPSVREAMGPIAASFFGRPSERMTVVGVTGTNGKTTTAFMLESVGRALGRTTGLLGTVETHIAGRVEPVVLTTPESIDLQRVLARMVDAGVEFASMEVSSIGLQAGRVAGTRFSCAVFTNLTQDHLDDHGTMEDYFAAKASLFDPRYTARAVVNVDDAYGRRLAASIGMDHVTFALDGGADVRPIEVSLDAGGTDLAADVAGVRIEVRVPLPGRYNVANALTVLATGVALGLPLEAVGAGIAATPGVPGRLEKVDAGQRFTVVVDYAHTPDALGNVLHAAREITPEGARLIVVFGCGGDRDRAKRPLMGRVASSLADRTIITSDNPRSEAPAEIVAEIARGARGDGAVVSIVDRRAAIDAAIEEAGPGDVVVIAGKGHETGQRFADHTIPFDDRIVAREALEARQA